MSSVIELDRLYFIDCLYMYVLLRSLYCSFLFFSSAATKIYVLFLCFEHMYRVYACKHTIRVMPQLYSIHVYVAISVFCTWMIYYDK